MEDWLNDPKVHSGVVFVIVSIGVYLVKFLVAREVKRIDQGLASAVKRSELEQFRSDIERRHEENSEALKEIKGLIERNHVDAVDGRHRIGNQLLVLTGTVAELRGRFEEMKRP